MPKLVYFRNWNGEKIDKDFEYEKRDKPLADFFNKRAKSCIEGKVTTIRTIYDDENKFIGYYVLSMSYIEAEDLYDEKRVATFPHPALKLGRLLIDKKYRGQRIGIAAITHIVMLAKKLNDFVVCRFIILDSKPWVVGFYEKMGFVVIGKIDKKESTVPMLFDLIKS